MSNSDPQPRQTRGYLEHPPVAERCTELSRKLDRLEQGGSSPAAALEAAIGLGALLRRRNAAARGGVGETLAALADRARRLLTPERLAEGLAGLHLTELAEAQRADPDEPEAELARAAAFLEGRERAEALQAAIEELGAKAALVGPLEALRRDLAALDRLGRAKLQRLLLLNVERRQTAAELDSDAAADWWWDLRLSCRPEALAAPGPLSEELLAHLDQCAACREEAMWLGRLDRLLGGTPDGHPSSAQLTAHAAGALDADERRTLAQHMESCASCRELHRAACAGLQESERIEQGLALAAALAVGPRAGAAASAPIHLPLVISPAPPARALAASGAAEPAPT